jgi:hypothetical protein
MVKEFEFSMKIRGFTAGLFLPATAGAKSIGAKSMSMSISPLLSFVEEKSSQQRRRLVELGRRSRWRRLLELDWKEIKMMAVVFSGSASRDSRFYARCWTGRILLPTMNDIGGFPNPSPNPNYLGTRPNSTVPNKKLTN